MKKPKLIFYKYNLLGNNFILLDRLLDIPYLDFDLSDFARFSLDTNFGIGGDNLIVISQYPKKGSNIGDLQFNYFEPDGSQFPLCANASLCAARHLNDYHQTPEFPFQVSISDRLIKFNIVSNKNGYFSLFFKRTFDISNYIKPQAFLERVNEHVYALPLHQLFAPKDTEYLGLVNKAYFVNIGEPHLIIYTNKESIFEDTACNYNKRIVWSEEFNKLGKIISHHTLFPEGINVNLVKVISPLKFEHRCYERGLSRETNACGSGALSSCIVNYFLQKTFMSDVVKVISLGTVVSNVSSSLEISLSGNFEWSLSGKPSFVYEGYANLSERKLYAY